MFEHGLFSRINWKPINFFTLLLVFTFFSIYSPATVSAAELCKEGKNDLVKSVEIINGKGGLWGIMEKTAGLKDKSVLGLQADGKMRRTVGIFEEMCEDGKIRPKKSGDKRSDSIRPGLYNPERKQGV